MLKHLNNKQCELLYEVLLYWNALNIYIYYLQMIVDDQDQDYFSKYTVNKKMKCTYITVSAKEKN